MSVTAAALVNALHQAVTQTAPAATANAGSQKQDDDTKADDKDSNDAVTSAHTGIRALRDLAKWLIAIFAAIAAILTAGIQLSSIGHLDSDDIRFKIAFVAIVITLISVGGIILFVVRVLTSGYTTLNQLAREEYQAPLSPLMGFIRDAGYLEAGYPTIRTLRNKYREVYGADGAVPVDAVVAAMLAGTNFYMVRRHFVQAVWAMLIFAGLAAAGITAFAWAANPPPPKPGAFQTPAEAFVTLSDGGKTALANALGANCVTMPVHVLVLSSTDTSATVVSIPTDDRRCKTVSFTVGTGPSGVNGYLAPVGAVSLPTGLAMPPMQASTNTGGTPTTTGSVVPPGTRTP